MPQLTSIQSSHAQLFRTWPNPNATQFLVHSTNSTLLIGYRARWHENRTIFNTPNPRLMNVSLLRDNKLLHGQDRRGSRMSVRAPSRQPSMASLRPHSPNPSLGKTGLYSIIAASIDGTYLLLYYASAHFGFGFFILFVCRFLVVQSFLFDLCSFV